ncbi:MAG TPA: hypothetical protein VMB52_07070 [Verrucomicrobiae bacterium]|nr:hypothetical protein [Verrucomicrobiae bacterium]
MRDRLVLYIQIHPRRALFAFILFWVVVIGSFPMYKFLLSGTVTVLTNHPANIIVTTQNGTTVATHYGSSLKARLREGSYTVTAVINGSSGAATSKRVVLVRQLRNTVYSLMLQGSLPYTTVLPSGTYGLVADSNQMLYVNTNDNLLYDVTGNNPPVALSPDITFSNVEWQNSSYGVGLGSDNNTLYSIKNQTISPINLPFSHSQLIYSLSSNGKLAVSDGKDVYTQQSDGSFKKVFASDSDDTIASLSAGSQEVLIRPSGTAAVQGGDSDDSDTAGIIVGYDGQRLTTQNSLPSFNSVWSPNGQRVAIVGDNDTTIYNAQLHLIATLPDGGVAGLTWLNDDTLLYTNAGSVYSYDVTDSDSRQLMRISGQSSVSGVYVSQDASQIYASAQTTIVGLDGSTESNSVVRTSLTTPEQQLSDNQMLATSFLPTTTTDGCQVSYVYFSSLIITVLPPPGSSSPASSCLQEAQDDLSNDFVDTSSLSFVLQNQP